MQDVFALFNVNACWHLPDFCEKPKSGFQFDGVFLLRPQTGFDVPQALAVSHLSKGHAEILFEIGKLLALVIAVVTIAALIFTLKKKRPPKKSPNMIFMFLIVI